MLFCRYLAAIPLIHRDVKPANVLAVVKPADFVLQKVLLADFGLAKQLSQSITRMHGSAAGTPLYQAPEMREEEEAKGPRADVFSAGAFFHFFCLISVFFCLFYAASS